MGPKWILSRVRILVALSDTDLISWDILRDHRTYQADSGRMPTGLAMMAATDALSGALNTDSPCGWILKIDAMSAIDKAIDLIRIAEGAR